VTPTEIVIELDDESSVTISPCAEDFGVADAAELSTDEGHWVWRPGEWRGFP
jgi:hypothetical protein